MLLIGFFIALLTLDLDKVVLFQKGVLNASILVFCILFVVFLRIFRRYARGFGGRKTAWLLRVGLYGFPITGFWLIWESIWQLLMEELKKGVVITVTDLTRFLVVSGLMSGISTGWPMVLLLLVLRPRVSGL